MPRSRIPREYTNSFKLGMVRKFEAARANGMKRTVFCKANKINRATLQNWERKKERLLFAVTRHCREEPGTRAIPSRASATTLAGSGRVSATAPMEDALLTFIKDERRLEHTVTLDIIVAAAVELATDTLGPRSEQARMSWCRRFLNRHGLTLRRISHSGRKTRADLEVLRAEFVQEVLRVVAIHCVGPTRSVSVARAVFNMDQTSVYCNLGCRSTVDFVGATSVRTTSPGSESYRCTMALTVAADGRMFPPHFVYKGAVGGDVEREVNSYCEAEVATFSVQANAWFDERVMLEWIDKCWKHIIVEPSVLILDSLKVHKKASVADALASMGTAVLYVPGGCTGVAQPLDVGVMSPVKQHIRRLHTERCRGRPPALTAPQRRRDSFERAVAAVGVITSATIRNAFTKAGSFN